MHSSMMRTVGSLPYMGSLSRGGFYPGGLCPGGWFPVQGVSVQGGLCQRETTPPVDRQRSVKILPCPKLRLRTVITTHSNHRRCLSAGRHSSVGAAFVCGLIGPRLCVHHVCGRDQEVGRCPSMSFIKTRMHSRRMRAARLLTVSQHALPRGGCRPRGCVGPGVCVSQHALRHTPPPCTE